MLKDILDKRCISVYKMSKETGISYSSLNDIVIEKTDLRNVSANMLYRIAKYLNMSMETLYENTDHEEVMIYLSNEGRNIILQFSSQHIQYMGPKNLLAFHRINKVEDNVIYVDCYFEDDAGFIYTEEDYIDLEDVLGDYNITVPSCYRTIIGRPSDTTREKLINNSLLVSDNIAILHYTDENIPDLCVQAISLARPASRAVIRLKDMEVISSNMGKALQKRALEAVRRNKDDVLEEVEAGKYA